MNPNVGKFAQCYTTFYDLNLQALIKKAEVFVFSHPLHSSLMFFDQVKAL
jgi:hypothetical protein